MRGQTFFFTEDRSDKKSPTYFVSDSSWIRFKDQHKENYILMSRKMYLAARIVWFCGGLLIGRWLLS